MLSDPLAAGAAFLWVCAGVALVLIGASLIWDGATALLTHLFF